MDIFIGTITRKIDSKSRITLPKWFNVQNGDELVFMRGNNCLTLWRANQWREHIDTCTKEVRKKEIAHARACYIDPMRRILIPNELRTFANIGSEGRFIGAETHAELWNPKLLLT